VGSAEGNETTLNILQVAQMKHARKTDFYAYVGHLFVLTEDCLTLHTGKST
jgi:hypothetical protein